MSYVCFWYVTDKFWVGQLSMFLVCFWFVLSIFNTPKKILFECMTKVCFSHFQFGMFWVLFRYINFVPKMILNGIFLICQKQHKHISDISLTYQIKLCPWYVTCMFLVCHRYVLGMTNHTFDKPQTYQKHTHNVVLEALGRTYFLFCYLV